MKKIFFLKIMLLIVFAQVVNGQNDFRKTAPKPGPAPKIELGKAEQFTMKNGLKVIVVENHKLPRVSFQVFVDVPPVLEGDYTGYRDLAGQLLSKGTKTKTKSQIDESVDFMGASLNTSAAGVTGSCLSRYKNNLLEIMSDVLLNPTFPVEEFDKVKKQTASGLEANKDDAEAIAQNVGSVMRYGKGHPYGEVTTEKTLEKITVEKCNEYYQQYFKPNISYLIITGDITSSEVKKLAPKYFGDWKMGDVNRTHFDTPQKPSATQVDFVDKVGAVQSVINITYPVEMKPGTEDVIKASVMNTVLGSYFGSRLMSNLREDKAFTYGAGSSLSTDPVIGNFNANASVRNEVTDSSIVQFFVEMERLQKETMPEEELSMVKNVMTGNFARSLEDPSTVARFALNTARYNLPADYYEKYLLRLSQVSVADIKLMANKYLATKNAHILVVGNKDDVAGKLATFSADKKVRFFDVYGNPIEQAGLEVPVGITAQTVLSDYLNAIGGKKLDGIKSVYLNMSANIQGMEMVTEMNQMAPNKLDVVNSMMGNIIMESIFDGEKGMNMQMGNKSAMEGASLEDMKIDAHLFPERFYEKLGVKTELKGIEMVEGKKAYKIQVEYPSGSKKTHYFDLETNLKIREIEDKDGNLVTNDITSYKEVDGIKFPEVVKITGLAPIPLLMTTKDVEINGEMDASLFIIK
ncbi:MAG: insulinase family protein [Saprospiraceae bacterium]|nr:insulinase family protein [Saprospiraceae bacterium]MCF8249337.1 insulinase family protein [Saprospiraceae bacterium]MCF8279758.1 insulinase family protein [Bacteroidales bacterium]MCF8311386.1 insulinase family protein [Saprospiraceae bacterium]MCF8439956.1 insulinase family protein [Saprospiraceae bacterium]